MDRSSEGFDRRFVQEVTQWLQGRNEHVPAYAIAIDNIEADAITAASIAASSPISAQIRKLLRNALKLVESPIEKYMLLALTLCAAERAHKVTLATKRQPPRHRN